MLTFETFALFVIMVAIKLVAADWFPETWITSSIEVVVRTMIVLIVAYLITRKRVE